MVIVVVPVQQTDILLQAVLENHHNDVNVLQHRHQILPPEAGSQQETPVPYVRHRRRPDTALHQSRAVMKNQKNRHQHQLDEHVRR